MLCVSLPLLFVCVSIFTTTILCAGYKGSSDLYIDSNIQLALAAAKQLTTDTGKRFHILLPDEAEYKRAISMYVLVYKQMNKCTNQTRSHHQQPHCLSTTSLQTIQHEHRFKSALDLVDGVTLGHLQEGKQNIFSGLTSLFSSGGDQATTTDPAAAAASADIFIVLNASTIELLDLEAYTNEKIGNRPMITWNMELDTLRADLGLLGFPPKDLQYRFLSYFKPVFYIRQRDYSKTVAVSPFIINYSGALFREYPGPWQVMLRQDNGTYACVAEDTGRRYGLGEFKKELTQAMGLNTEAEGSAMAFLRSGYKTSTWWEDDEDKEESKGWRS